MLQMKLQLGMKIFHHLLTSPASKRMIWWLFNVVVGIYVLVTTTTRFSRQMQLDMLKSDLWEPKYKFMLISWYLSIKYLHILKGIISYFCSSLMVLIVGRWRKISFNNFRLKIFLSGTAVNPKIQTREISSFLFISFFYSL